MNEPTRDEIAEFEADRREGIGDKRRAMSENYWARAIPESEMPAPASGDAYRAEKAWLSGIYRAPEWAGAQKANTKANVYVDGTKDLNAYAAAKPRHAALQRDGESDVAFTRRVDATVRPNLDELPEDLVAEIVAEYNAAAERITSGEARGDTRKTGDGIGIAGEAQQTVRGPEGAKSYRDIQGSRAESLYERQQQSRDAEAERLRWLRGASLSGYEPIARLPRA